MEGVLSVFCQVFDGVIYCEGYQRWRATVQNRRPRHRPGGMGGYGGLQAVKKTIKNLMWSRIMTQRNKFSDGKKSF